MRSMLAAVFCLLLAGAATAPAQARDEAVTFRANDPEMTAAIEKARQTIETFWNAKSARGEGVAGFALKVGISEPGSDQVEHFWLIRVRKHSDGKLSGEINNEPNFIKSVKFGQRYVFHPDMISDWMFVRNGMIVGAWTLRVIINRMPGERTDYLRSHLEKP